jgi:hypothetical protein
LFIYFIVTYFSLFIKNLNKMGKLKGGILGPVTGKVGAVVGSVVGGQNVLKSMPASYADKKSDSQIEQRGAFKATLELYQAISGVVKQAFVEKPAVRSAYNEFMSQNVGAAITSDTISWGDLVIAKGSLSAPTIACTFPADPTKINFAWTNDADGSNKLASDKIICCAINSATKEIVATSGTQTRATGTAVLTVPAHFAGVDIQTYAYALRADGKKSSNTIRAGKGRVGSELAGSVQ